MAEKFAEKVLGWHIEHCGPRYLRHWCDADGNIMCPVTDFKPCTDLTHAWQPDKLVEKQWNLTLVKEWDTPDYIAEVWDDSGDVHVEKGRHPARAIVEACLKAVGEEVE